MDYECEKVAKSNFEPWRQNQDGPHETDEERRDRLEQEAAEVDAMGQLEGKMVDAKREMAIADALDEIRTRNARNERRVKAGDASVAVEDELAREKERQDREDEELAKLAFASKEVETPSILVPEDRAEGEEKASAEEHVETNKTEAPSAPSFKRGVKRKKDLAGALGIKKKPALV